MAAARARWTRYCVWISGLALAVFGFAIAAALVRFWGTNPQYADRVLVILAAGWLIWRSREFLAPAPGLLIGLPILVLGICAAGLGWYLFGQFGPRTPLLWWLAASWLCVDCGALLLLGGLGWLRTLLFPLVFFLFALPIPDLVEIPLQARLQSITTSAAEWGLKTSGIAVKRDGFELHLPSGSLEVVEACSGVRSISALLAIAALVAHLYGFGVVRGIFMLLLAFPVIAAVNSLRVMLTGWLQEAFGTEWSSGTPHEVLGVLMVLVGLVMVCLLAHLLRPTAQTGDESGAAKSPALATPLPDSGGINSRSVATVVAVLLLVGVGVSAYAALLGRAQVIEQAQNAPLDQIPYVINAWTAKDLPIPPETRDMLTYDRALFRRYEDDLGHEIYVWVIYWQASTAIRGYHHPDVCFPNRGWTTARKDQQNLILRDGAEVPCTIRHFERGRLKMRLYYWTQEGGQIIADENEFRSAYGLERLRHYLDDRLTGQPVTMSARMTVLIQAELPARNERDSNSLSNFASNFCEQLYSVCPWARIRPGDKAITTVPGLD